MENNCLIREDACPGLLNLYPIRILTVRSRALKLARVRLSIKRQLPLTSYIKRSLSYVLVSCTTNLCLCKSFKERAPEESASKVGHPIGEAASPHLRVQRYAFSANWQNISRFFLKKDAFLPSIHYILYMRATEGDGRGAMASLHTGRRGGEEGAC